MTNPTNTTNESRFTAKSTMLECLTADPSLGMVLMRDFHLGGCRNCGCGRGCHLHRMPAFPVRMSILITMV